MDFVLATAIVQKRRRRVQQAGSVVAFVLRGVGVVMRIKEGKGYANDLVFAVCFGENAVLNFW